MQANVKKWKYKTIAIMAPDSVSCLLRWCCFSSLCELFCRTSGEFQLKSWVQGQTGMHAICQQSSDELPVGSNLGPSIIQGHTSLKSFRIPPSRPAAVVLQVWLLYLELMDVSEWCSDVVTPTLFIGSRMPFSLHLMAQHKRICSMKFSVQVSFCGVFTWF